MANMSQWDSVRDGDASLVLLLEDNVGRIFIDTYTEAFELVLDDSFVSEGLVHIKNDENEMTGFGNGNDLTASTFAILGSLNDTGQIKHLDGCTVVLHLTRYSGQSSKLVCSSWGWS